MKRILIGVAVAALLAGLETAWGQSVGPVAGPGGPGNISPPILTQSGHVLYAGAIPVISACGGTLAPATGSTDTSGEATGAGAATACTVTFGQPYNSAPSCQVTDETGTRAGMSVATTATGFTVSGITALDKFSWHCGAKIGF